MIKPKLYCPFCELELSGAVHKNNSYAWSEFNCEFNAKLQDEKPTTEMQIKKKALSDKVKMKNKLNSDIRILKKRITELGLVT